MRTPRYSNSKVDTVQTEIRKSGARVQRDGLVAFLLGGGFADLEPTPQHVIDSPIKRQNDADGWTVPRSELGRAKGAPTVSTTNSVLLWIKKNLSEHVDPHKVAVTLEGEGDDSEIVIYRKG